MEDQSINESIQQAVEELNPELSDIEKKKMVQTIEDAFLRGIPVRQSLGINDDTMEALYSQGHRLYSTRKYERAAKLFQALAFLDPKDFRYMLGVAASFQLGKEYEKAIGWYLALSILDTSSPLPFYYISDCFLKQNEYLASLDFLKKTVERCGDVALYKNLKAKATMMMEPLEEEIAKLDLAKEK